MKVEQWKCSTVYNYSLINTQKSIWLKKKCTRLKCSLSKLGWDGWGLHQLYLPSTIILIRGPTCMVYREPSINLHLSPLLLPPSLPGSLPLPLSLSLPPSLSLSPSLSLLHVRPHIGVGTMGAPGAGAPLCFLIARLNFLHTDHVPLAYRSIESPFTKPSSYAPATTDHTHLSRVL